MVLFCSSWAHDQARLIIECLAQQGVESLQLDLHGLCDRADGLVLSHAADHLTLRDAHGPMDVRGIYWNGRPRMDAAIPTIPVSSVASYRSRLRQFVDDLGYAFESRPQFPGTQNRVSRAESKPSLFREAARAGLIVPSFTQNAVGGVIVQDLHKTYGRIYRKVLGPPCVVSEDGIATTTTNVALKEWTPETPGGGQAWQYQPIVPFVEHIRCYVVGRRVWAAAWQHTPTGDEWDLRYLQEVLGQEADFHPVEFPQDLADRLVTLNERFGLTHSAPEFLRLQNGTYVFIDLNPCGDWLGFFPDAWSGEIADALAAMIGQRLSL